MISAFYRVLYQDAHPTRLEALIEKHKTHIGGYPVLVQTLELREKRVLLAEMTVERCGICHLIVGIKCDHTNTSWNEEGTLLMCQFCGIDCT